MRRLAPAVTAVALFSLLAACGDDVPDAGEAAAVDVQDAGADDGKISFEEFTKMVENTDVSMSMTLGTLHCPLLRPLSMF